MAANEFEPDGMPWVNEHDGTFIIGFDGGLRIQDRGLRIHISRLQAHALGEELTKRFWECAARDMRRDGKA